MNKHLLYEAARGEGPWRAFWLKAFNFLVILVCGPLSVILASTLGGVVAEMRTGLKPKQSVESLNIMLGTRYLLIQIALCIVLWYMWEKRPQRRVHMAVFLIAIPFAVFMGKIPTLESTLIFSCVCSIATYLVLSARAK